MSNVNTIHSKQQPAVDTATGTSAARQSSVAESSPSARGGSAEDVSGVKQAEPAPPKPAATLVMPAFASAGTEAAVAAALDKLEGKTADVQKAVAEAAAALGAFSALAGNLFSSKILDGLVRSVVDAAGNNLGAPFGALYASLDQGLDELLAAHPKNAPLKTAADSARTIMDILEKGAAHERAEELAAALADLASLALVADKAPDAEKMAAALAATLHNVLGIAAEAAVLGDKLTELLAQTGARFPQLPSLPDALAASGRMTGEAVLGLAMIIAAKVQQELAVLMESRDEDSRKVQEAQNRRQDVLRAMERDLERSALLKESQAVSAAAVFAAFGQCGEAGAQFLNALILMRQVDSVPRNPV